MQSALHITSDEGLNSPAFKARIREKVVKLEQVCPRLSACRVLLTAPQRNPQQRRMFTVRLNIKFPRGEVVVTRDNHEDLGVLLRDAFVAVRRELDRCAWRDDAVNGHREPCACRAFAVKPEPDRA